MNPRDIRLSKISIPEVTGVLPRETLFARLDRLRQKPLVWVHAPGGAGKTTLISSYLEARRLTGLWYQVDAGDTDPATFFYYLGLAGQKAAPRRKQPFPLMTPEYLRGLPEFSRNFFSQLFACIKPPAALVLDDLQEVPDSASLHTCLIDGLTRIPQGLTIILVSRSCPPPCYVKLLANRTMELLGWDDLRLTRKEFREIRCYWGCADSAQVDLDALYEKMDGWAAGLLLLLRSPEGQTLQKKSEWQQTPEEIFSYFAEQLFNRAESEVQSCLMHTAFLPEITLAMADEISGNGHFRTILKNLAHRNFFTTRRHEPTLTYEYHPLFRLFLKEMVSRHFQPSEILQLKLRSAHVLLVEDQAEEAADLYAGIQAWPDLTRLILTRAPSILQQGRFKTLLRWIGLLPAKVVQGHAWLLYWRAVASKPLNVFDSREDFARACYLFREAGQAEGTYLAWTGVVETFIYLWGNFRLLDPWLEVFDEIQREHPQFPTDEIRDRVTNAMFSALLWRHSNSPAMKIWARRAESLVRETSSPTIRLLAGSNLLKYYLWCCGDLSRAEIFIETLGEIDQKTTSPLAFLLSRVMLATCAWFRNDMASCLDMVEKGLAFARSSGIHLMDTALNAHAVYALLLTGERTEAKRYLKQMGQLTSEHSHIDVAHFHYLKVWLYLEEEKFPAALAHSRTVVEHINAAGTRQAMGFGQYTLGLALCETGDFAGARRAIDKGREYGRSMDNGYFEAFYLFARALLGLRQGKHAEATERVRTALAIARDNGYSTMPWIGWYRSAFTDLLQFAIDQDQERLYARRLVRAHRLIPKPGAGSAEHWPWPLKIFSLGPFTVLRDEQPLRFERKAQKRPMELLQALIAMGSQGVSQVHLEDALWPNAPGDSARSSFNMALHRLRKLIGADCLVLEKGKLSLDFRYCWSDLKQFEDNLGALEKLQTTGDQDMGKLCRLVEATMHLVRGPFLSQEQEHPWMFPLRDRLRQKLRRQVRGLGRSLGRQGYCHQAMTLYRKGIEIDPLAEEYYRSLMSCYSGQGRYPEALATYQECRETLIRKLRVAPGPATETLLQEIRNLDPTHVPQSCTTCHSDR